MFQGRLQCVGMVHLLKMANAAPNKAICFYIQAEAQMSCHLNAECTKTSPQRYTANYCCLCPCQLTHCSINFDTSTLVLCAPYSMCSILSCISGGWFEVLFFGIAYILYYLLSLVTDVYYSEVVTLNCSFRYIEILQCPWCIPVPHVHTCTLLPAAAYLIVSFLTFPWGLV